MTKKDFNEKFMSRRFLIVVLCFALLVYMLFAQKTEWITVATILTSGIMGYVNVSTFFKEKNYKGGGTGE